jgi:Transmembrane family 220, helix
MFVRANVVAAALFTFAAAVQVNDPDPLLWMAVYVAAAVVAGLAVGQLDAADRRRIAVAADRYKML